MVKIGKAKIKKEKAVMLFGKYEGEYLEDIPVDYLEWLYNQKGFRQKHPRLAKQMHAVLMDDEYGSKFVSEYDDVDDDYGYHTDEDEDDEIPW
jgi:uncharacterized protein (DUF3820 family)